VTKHTRTGRTRVKICGLTRDSDLEAAVDIGADAIGLVFHAPSSRAVEIEQARRLLSLLPPFVTGVALFVDAQSDFVRAVLDRAPFDSLQFHGEEPPDYCGAFGRPWIKVIRMRPETNLQAQCERYTGARGLLLDTYDPATAGGTGRRFDWELVPEWLAPRIILAGGLTPDNVAEAVRRVGPYAVDVSGGVESAKGVKDRAKLEAFLQGVRDGDKSR
jgi:phosphoribosylanthranilate isomerase